MFTDTLLSITRKDWVIEHKKSKRKTWGRKISVRRVKTSESRD